MNRPKTVFDRSELAHIWASQSQEEGRAKTTKMSFRGPLLYSYNTGIARLCEFKGKKYVLLNTHSFGPTTAQHQSDARQAISHYLYQFQGDWGSYNTDLIYTPKEIVAKYVEWAKWAAEQTSKVRHKQYKLWIHAAHQYVTAIHAAEFFGMGTVRLEKERQKLLDKAEPLREISEAFDAASEERVRVRREAQRRKWDRLNEEARANRQRILDAFLADHTVKGIIPSEWQVPEEQKEAYLAQVRKRNEWIIESAKERLEAWTRGEDVDDEGFYSSPVRLRVKHHACEEEELEGREIETSHGAVIPYRQGKLCYLFCMKHRPTGWRSNGKTFKVGVYQLSEITGSGIRVGCHDIWWDEIDRFAKQEGWILSNLEEQ